VPTNYRALRMSLFTAALFVMPLCAAAQGFGFLGGFSLGSASAPNVNTASQPAVHANSGVAFGLSAETGGNIGVGADVLFAQRLYSNTAGTLTQQVSYADVPLYLKMTIPSLAIDPFVLLGPQTSIWLACSGDGCASSPSLTFAAVGGVGARFGMQRRLSLQVRYVYGVTNESLSGGVENPGGISEPPNGSVYRTRSCVLLGGIHF
jgi:hypothetical protein